MGGSDWVEAPGSGPADHPVAVHPHYPGSDPAAISYDAIEHNAQFLLPESLSWLPVLGIANRGVNRGARKLAWEYHKPFVGTSDAHNLDKGAFGMSYIEFDKALPDLSGSDKFLSSFKDIIRNNEFRSEEGYATLLSWAKWCAQFVLIHREIPNERLTSVKN